MNPYELVVFREAGTHRRYASLRKPLQRALEAAVIRDRSTPHGFRRTWNNLLRQVASGAITRSMIGHETDAKVEGSGAVSDSSNASRKQNTRNDQPILEREMGFEPTTSTLARLHSTTELFPQKDAIGSLVGLRRQAGDSAPTRGYFAAKTL